MKRREFIVLLSGVSVWPLGVDGQLLRQVVPGLHRLAIMANIGNAIGVLEMGRSGRRPARWASTSSPSKSGARRTLHLESRRSRAARTRKDSRPDDLASSAGTGGRGDRLIPTLYEPVEPR
jgi:hypothetical protein